MLDKLHDGFDDDTQEHCGILDDDNNTLDIYSTGNNVGFVPNITFNIYFVVLIHVHVGDAPNNDNVEDENIESHDEQDDNLMLLMENVLDKMVSLK